MKTHQTLGEFIIQNQKDFQHSTGEFSRLLSAIKLASKLVNREVNKAGLVEDILGDMGQENVQGEVQKKLDVFANELFIRALTQRDVVCGIASEENEFFIPINASEHSPNSKYVVLIDPLDGSSNADVSNGRNYIFYLQTGYACRYACAIRRFFAGGQQAGGCGLCSIRAFYNASIHHRARGEWLYS